MTRRVLCRPTPTLSGLGLFGGQPASVTIRPSPAATGVLFTAPGRGPVRVHVTRCVDWKPARWPAALPIRNTSIGVAPWSVGTVEHILSALAGLGISDAIIDIEGPEIPILDGSALPFVEALLPCIEEEDTRPLVPFRLRRAVEVSDGGGGLIRAEPRDEGCSFTYELDYGPNSPIPAQAATWQGDADDYARNVAPARTFSLMAEAQAARAAGLFQHFSPSDMVVVGDDGAPIDNAWRLEHEPARHKLLDLIGDLSLLGVPPACLCADITARRSGHALTRELCRRMLAERA
jgi:UDP-3-O-acyl-N-acetylglucosamine deacetylase